ncbi:hypothetical protein GCM10007301_46610 [Azorhizobium oxalatiphilum]|uniref:M23ase beta-sheet core domain-containing protein n=1 Tax=Azorhizobium oxalatiphilum TaxID=980631 RepID=A0A917CCV0_9HYPH|nr:M23 family metallopeptidase [Azorhizobium oxalatiphilum]GGF81157.1 hypothetical protein GCM10007301_46610 [Azorhizobium oxalatiphilum]
MAVRTRLVAPVLAGASPLGLLGDGAPLGLDGQEHSEAGSRPQRSRFNRRWLSATGLMGTVAVALMCGALFAAIDRQSRHVSRPILAARLMNHRSGGDKPRGDRLHTAAARETRRDLKRELKVEQLTASGMHAFTHVAARLGAVVAATADLPAGNRPPPPADAGPPDADDVPPPMADAMPSRAEVAQARRVGHRGAHTQVAAAQAVADAALGAMAHRQPAPPPPSPALGFAPPPVPAHGLPPEILHGASVSAPLAVPAPPPPSSFPMFENDTSAIGEPVNISVLEKAESRPQVAERVLVAKSGDTPEDMLRAAGIDTEDAQLLATGLRRAAGRARTALAGGEEIVLSEPTEGEAHAPTSGIVAHPRPLKVRLARGGATLAALVATDAGAYVPLAAAAPIPAAAAGDPEAVDPAVLDGVSVRDALYRLADAHVLDEELVDELVRLAGNDMDLDTSLSAADGLDLVYAPPEPGDSRAEAFRQEVVFAALTVDGRVRRYYRFRTPDDGAVDYYDATGHSVTKLLLRKPFAKGRLNDGFGWRIHPILHDRRFHNGVDYTGPAGSPIVAAGDGVVEKIDYEGGYGKYVRVKHDGGYETTYAHVEGFPSGLKVGQRVRQGQTVAFVGSTGLSTGPHLYYELRINGHYADPTRVKLAGGRMLSGDMAGAFQKERARMDALAAARPLPEPAQP